jgi:hypothetical protein
MWYRFSILDPDGLSDFSYSDVIKLDDKQMNADMFRVKIFNNLKNFYISSVLRTFSNNEVSESEMRDELSLMWDEYMVSILEHRDKDAIRLFLSVVVDYIKTLPEDSREKKLLDLMLGTGEIINYIRI